MLRVVDEPKHVLVAIGEDLQIGLVSVLPRLDEDVRNAAVVSADTARHDPLARIAEGDRHDRFVSIELDVGEVARVAVDDDVPVVLVIPAGRIRNGDLPEHGRKRDPADRRTERVHERPFTRIS
jgi:hypothetical protein